jgi:hypothetical protein
MDMSFARRNVGWTKSRRPAVDFTTLVSSLSARQSTSPTALHHTKLQGGNEKISNFCSAAARFAPLQNEVQPRQSASFDVRTALILTDRQSS